MRSSSSSLAVAIIVALSSTSAAVNYASAGSSRSSSHTSLLHRHRLTRRQQLDLELQQFQNGNNSLKTDPARYVASIARGGGSSSGTTSKAKSKGAQVVRAATSQSNDNTSDDAAPIIIRGGASNNNNNNEDDGSISLLGITINPRALATLSMAICMSLHYLAYSLARPATMTLFTSSRLGFGNNVSAYPFAMTFISPVSFVLLLFYGSVLNNLGPLLALKHTTLGCASILGLSSLLISKLDPQIIEGDTTSLLAILTRYTVGALFIFRESYVQLITSQHWSFISSVLTPNQSSTWFAPISGLTSITSALAAMGVGKLSAVWGLQGVLGVAAVVLGGSVVFGEAAYGIAEKNGFNPADEHKKKHGKSSSSKTNNDESLITKARDVFTRVPTLWALFCEILACQGLSTVLNVLTVTKVSEVISDDTERAGWMGNFFATINVLSCVFQFGILPATSKYTEPSMLWKGMPMLMLVMTCFVSVPKLSGGTNGDPSLNLIASAFLVMKTLEFSVRRMLDEMVYVPLDFESRFLGKEVIGVLGYRFGKSAASLALSALTSSFGTIGLRELSYFTNGAASVWLVAAWKLSALVPTRAEAEEAYEKMKKSS
eukprot:scaffold7649_cov154-Skeletonema_marinoi.AAC.12